MQFETQRSITAETSQPYCGDFAPIIGLATGVSQPPIIAEFRPPLPPAVADGGVFTAAPASTLVARITPESSPIVLDVMPQAGDRGFSMGTIWAANDSAKASNCSEGVIRVLPPTCETPPRGVRPCVAEFIKRVIVPILIQRFIDRHNSGTLSACIGETL
jgi:hypothetical protein